MQSKRFISLLFLSSCHSMENRLNHFLKLKEQISKAPFAKSNISAAKGEGIAYWRYRLLRPFFKIRYLRFQKRNPKLPWLTPDAINLIEQLVKGGHGLEFGSGRSTLYFSQLLDKLDSVEHHKAWHEKVQNMLNDKGIKNTSLHHVPADDDFDSPYLSSEEQVFMTDEEYPLKDEIFSKYTSTLDQFENESLDFVLVDGRARKSCALKAEIKLKKGGILLLDNSERLRYKAVHQQFEKYPSIQTTTGLTDTTFWLKT